MFVSQKSALLGSVKPEVGWSYQLRSYPNIERSLTCGGSVWATVNRPQSLCAFSVSQLSPNDPWTKLCTHCKYIDKHRISCSSPSCHRLSGVKGQGRPMTSCNGPSISNLFTLHSQCEFLYSLYNYPAEDGAFKYLYDSIWLYMARAFLGPA